MATNKKSSKPSKFVQPQKQVIETPPDFKAAYANVVYTTVTEHDFTLTFGRVTGPRKALASVSATMPLSLMKDVVELLGRELMKAQLAKATGSGQPQ
jgi:hypothetical protein